MKILISPGFGAGWSSWCYDNHEATVFMLTYEPLIETIERGEDIGYVDDFGGDKFRPGTPMARFVDDYKERFGDTPYLGGARDLAVREVDQPFRIHEYDGSESVEYRDNVGWVDPRDFIEYEQQADAE
jgi:hypothetical protein